MDIIEAKLPGTSKNKKKKRPTLRFDLNIPDSNDTSCPEYSYVDLVRQTLKEKKSKGENDTMCQDLLEEEEEKEKNEAEALANYYEVKYGTNEGQKRKRKDRPRDLIDAGYGYDETDPFVDDSEAYDEIVPASLTTQHGGFYINTGKLEFRPLSDGSDQGGSSSDDTVPLSQHISKKKKSKNTMGLLTSDESENEFKKDGGVEKKKRKKKMKASKDHENKKKRKISFNGKDKMPNLKQNAKKIKKSSTSYAQKLVAKAKAQHMMNVSSVGSPAHSTIGNLTPHRKISSEDHNGMKSGIGEFGQGLKSIQDKDLVHVAKQATKQLMNIGKDNLNSNLGDKITETPIMDGTKTTMSSPENYELPPHIPKMLEDKIDSLKKLAKSAEGEGKQKFFSSDVNSILLGIDEGSQNLRTKERQGMYQHIAHHLPCSKETLMKRVKKLHVNSCDQQLKGPLDRLKQAVDAVMTYQIQDYVNACSLQAQSGGKLPDKLATAAASTDEDEESEDRADPGQVEGGEKMKRTYAPRRKFKWNDNLKKLLCEVVSVKMSLYEKFKVRERQSPEEYLKAFLETSVKPLWPKPWMQTRMLFKESRAAHSHLTLTNSCPKQKKRDSVPSTDKTQEHCTVSLPRLELGVTPCQKYSSRVESSSSRIIKHDVGSRQSSHSHQLDFKDQITKDKGCRIYPPNFDRSKPGISNHNSKGLKKKRYFGGKIRHTASLKWHEIVKMKQREIRNKNGPEQHLYSKMAKPKRIEGIEVRTTECQSGVDGARKVLSKRKKKKKMLIHNGSKMTNEAQAKTSQNSGDIEEKSRTISQAANKVSCEQEGSVIGSSSPNFQSSRFNRIKSKENHTGKKFPDVRGDFSTSSRIMSQDTLCTARYSNLENIVKKLHVHQSKSERSSQDIIRLVECKNMKGKRMRIVNQVIPRQRKSDPQSTPSGLLTDRKQTPEILSGKKILSVKQDKRTLDPSLGSSQKTDVVKTIMLNNQDVQKTTAITKNFKKQLTYESQASNGQRQTKIVSGGQPFNSLGMPHLHPDSDSDVKKLIKMASDGIELIASIESEASPNSSPISSGSQKFKEKSVSSSQLPSVKSDKKLKNIEFNQLQSKIQDKILHPTTGPQRTDEQFFASEWLKIASSFMFDPASTLAGASSVPGYMGLPNLPNLNNIDTLSSILGLKPEDMLPPKKAATSSKDDKFKFKIASTSLPYDLTSKNDGSTYSKVSSKNTSIDGVKDKIQQQGDNKRTALNTLPKSFAQAKGEFSLTKQRGFSSVSNTPPAQSSPSKSSSTTKESFTPLDLNQTKLFAQNSSNFAVPDSHSSKFVSTRPRSNQRPITGEKNLTVSPISFHHKSGTNPNIIMQSQTLSSSPTYIRGTTGAEILSSTSHSSRKHTPPSKTSTPGHHQSPQMNFAHKFYTPPTTPSLSLTHTFSPTHEGAVKYLNSSPSSNINLFSSGSNIHSPKSTTNYPVSYPLPQVKLYDIQGKKTTIKPQSSIQLNFKGHQNR